MHEKTDIHDHLCIKSNSIKTSLHFITSYSMDKGQKMNEIRSCYYSNVNSYFIQVLKLCSYMFFTKYFTSKAMYLALKWYLNKIVQKLFKRHVSFILLGVYKKEEAHLLLKIFQIKGQSDIFVSKFENDNWALDGYVSNQTTIAC